MIYNTYSLYGYKIVMYRVSTLLSQFNLSATVWPCPRTSAGPRVSCACRAGWRSRGPRPGGTGPHSHGSPASISTWCAWQGISKVSNRPWFDVTGIHSSSQSFLKVSYFPKSGSCTNTYWPASVVIPGQSKQVPHLNMQFRCRTLILTCSVLCKGKNIVGSFIPYMVQFRMFFFNLKEKIYNSLLSKNCF